MKLMRIPTCVAIVSCFCGAALADNYSVHPGDDVAAVINAIPGDFPITFAPGNYTLPTVLHGAGAVLPTGRHYVGNGATIALSGGLAGDTSELMVFKGSPRVTEVSGFIFTNGQIHCESGVFKVHDNTFTNGTTGIFVGGQHDSHFDHNAFSKLNGGGIYGYPGNNNTYNNNTFDYVIEPIHLVAACDKTDVSNNVITHATRIGIELQNGMTHLTVNNNWMSDWLQFGKGNDDAHMGISCATGGHGQGPNGTAPWVGWGEHITITGNVLIQNGPAQNLNHWAKAAIEIMGDQDITIARNYAWGWGCGVLNGTYTKGPDSSNNIWVCEGMYSTDGGNWPKPEMAGTGDQLFNLNDPKAPAWPPMPGAPATPSAAPAAAPATAPSSSAASPPDIVSAVSTLDSTPTTQPAISPAVTHVNAITVDGKVIWQQQVFSDGSVK